ncbi:UNKNOWN [Stylonychia lemnae]|uniref:Uncharacterized protein n=1 Tax=Stylonychia lemnae TaxID=5949 RepID=A0A078AVJ3_STYLE|nr:UNKNOWN [Stylonychia lemnae]|eukprot:CDW86380.1 UNKNOWN [Stylonychia lemnae]
MNLTIPGTEECFVNAMCYKDAAINLFLSAVVLPTLVIILFILISFCVRKRIMIENYENDSKLKQIRAVFDSHNDNDDSDPDEPSAAIAYLNEVRMIEDQDNKLFATTADLKNKNRRHNHIQNKAETDIDLAKPHMPEFSYRRGLRLDDLIFEAHKNQYKEVIRQRILAQREEIKKQLEKIQLKKEEGSNTALQHIQIQDQSIDKLQSANNPIAKNISKSSLKKKRSRQKLGKQVKFDQRQGMESYLNKSDAFKSYFLQNSLKAQHDLDDESLNESETVFRMEGVINNSKFINSNSDFSNDQFNY